MTKKERVLTALRHEEPDRVPVYPILSGVTRKLVGATYQEWSTNADLCAEALIKAADLYDQDCIVSLIDLSVECAAWGQQLVFPENEAAHPDYDNQLIEEIEDYEKIRKLDVTKAQRMMMHVDVVRKLKAAKGEELPIIAFVFGPLGTLSMLRNQQELYMDLYDDPDAVKAAVREVNETLKDYCSLLIDAGADAIMIDTLFASGSIMSKDMWVEFEGEIICELTDMIREKGAQVMIHNCGERIYFDVQLQYMHPSAISFLYPPDDCADFAECKQKYGSEVTLIGCVTPASAVYGTDEKWDQECRDSMDAMMAGGGFILATGCEYPANASFDRAVRMAELAKTYGVYKKEM